MLYQNLRSIGPGLMVQSTSNSLNLLSSSLLFFLPSFLFFSPLFFVGSPPLLFFCSHFSLKNSLSPLFFFFFFFWLPPLKTRGGKVGSTRWTSPVRPELELSWAIKLLARKKSGQIWPSPIWPGLVWPDPARPVRIFFCFQKDIWPDQPGF